MQKQLDDLRKAHRTYVEKLMSEKRETGFRLSSLEMENDHLFVCFEFSCDCKANILYNFGEFLEEEVYGEVWLRFSFAFVRLVKDR